MIWYNLLWWSLIVCFSVVEKWNQRIILSMKLRTMKKKRTEKVAQVCTQRTIIINKWSWNDEKRKYSFFWMSGMCHICFRFSDFLNERRRFIDCNAYWFLFFALLFLLCFFCVQLFTPICKPNEFNVPRPSHYTLYGILPSVESPKVWNGFFLFYFSEKKAQKCFHVRGCLSIDVGHIMTAFYFCIFNWQFDCANNHVKCSPLATRVTNYVVIKTISFQDSSRSVKKCI